MNEAIKITLHTDTDFRDKLKKIAEENGVSIQDVIMAATNQIVEMHDAGTKIVIKK